MRIAIIGAGSVGSALGRAFGGLGHAITFGLRTPGDPDYQRLARELGADLADPDAAAGDADLVILAVPARSAVEAARSVGDLAGKILMDTTNPVGPDLLPLADEEGGGRSQAERIAAAVPGARVVKAFHTLAAEHMGHGRMDGRSVALFLCGDDAAAKDVVSELASSLGFEPVDVGGLDRARLTEPLALVWITLAARQGYGRGFGFGLVRRAPGSPQ